MENKIDNNGEKKTKKISFMVGPEDEEEHTPNEVTFSIEEPETDNERFSAGSGLSNLESTDKNSDRLEVPRNFSLMASKRHKPRKVVIELYSLRESKLKRQWTEVGRFQKYEEDLNSDSNWGHPHLPFLAFHSLVQLRNCLAKGVLLFDLHCGTFQEACGVIAKAMAQKFRTNSNKLETVLQEMEQSKKPSNIKRKFSMAKLNADNAHANGVKDKRKIGSEDKNPRKKSWIAMAISSHDLKTSVEDHETAQVYAAPIDEIDNNRFAMIRFSEPLDCENTAAPIRFLFVLLGPAKSEINHVEIGRSFCTLMSNPSFQEIAYRAMDRRDLIGAVDSFLDGCVIIAPCDIRNKRLISPEEILKALKKRQTHAFVPTGPTSPITQVEGSTEAENPFERDPLERSGKLFGNLLADLKTLRNRYKSDFTDGFRLRILTSIIFIFFANFAPAISFGGLMGAYTNDQMGAIETLLAQCICGLIWGFCSTQPLLVLSATGPVLIFEASLFMICQQLGFEFLTIRLYTGIWFFLITVVAVMLEAASLLRYITRFTEEIFSTLISAIFILESIAFLKRTFDLNPVEDLMYYWYKWETCVNNTGEFSVDSDLETHMIYWEEKRSDLGHFTVLDEYDRQCFDHNQPDTALITVVLMFATFTIAYFMKQLRTSYFFGRTLRQAIGDFGLLISIAFCAFLAYVVFDKIYLQRFDMPTSIEFTLRDKRHWIFVGWLVPADQWWVCLVTFVPALLVFILIFVETGVTELLLCQKERCLTKGSGIHWDLLLVGLLTLLCSIFGLPWMCAAAAQSLAHCSSLSVVRPHAPGEKPQVDHVIEQRITTVAVSLLLGACAFAGLLLRFLPLAIVFGVFLYLGVIDLISMQFIRRLLLFFVPPKYFPNNTYCEEVKPLKIHLFTLIQMVCIGIVYTVKEFKATAMVFPIVQVLACIVRQKILPFLFSHKELEALDGHSEEDDEEFYDMITVIK